MRISLNRTLALTAVALSLFAAVRAQTRSQPATSTRTDQFQNDTVKVWRTTVLPDAPLTLHRHDHPRIIVALTDGSMDLLDANGSHELHVWQKDHAYWLPSMPPGAMHKDVNAGGKPLEVMVIELEKER